MINRPYHGINDKWKRYTPVKAFVRCVAAAIMLLAILITLLIITPPKHSAMSVNQKMGTK